MKLALLFALGSTTPVSALFPIGASASQEVACFYKSGTTSGSFLLKVGKLQAHIDVEEIADDVEEEMLDGDGVEQESGFDAIAWVNSFLEKGLGFTKNFHYIKKL